MKTRGDGFLKFISSLMDAYYLAKGFIFFIIVILILIDLLRRFANSEYAVEGGISILIFFYAVFILRKYIKKTIQRRKKAKVPPRMTRTVKTGDEPD